MQPYFEMTCLWLLLGEGKLCFVQKMHHATKKCYFNIGKLTKGLISHLLARLIVHFDKKTDIVKK